MGDSIQTLVNRLNQLHEGWKVQCQLIALGQEAVPFLVDFLLAQPSMFPQPRCWAAEALATSGGDQALEGLCNVLSIHDVTRADPVIPSPKKPSVTVPQNSLSGWETDGLSLLCYRLSNSMRCQERRMPWRTSTLMRPSRSLSITWKMILFASGWPRLSSLSG
jgi:hypothetical protein